MFAPERWTPRRILGEALLSTVLGLLTLSAGVMYSILMPGSDVDTAQLVTAGLAAALLSLLRRFFPATVLLASAIGMAPSGLFYSDGSFLGVYYPLLPVAAWSAGRRIEGIGKAAGVFATAYILALTMLVLRPTSPPLPLTMPLAAQVLVMLAVPGLTSRYWSQRRTLTDTLRDYHAQLVRERRMVAGQARMRERQRIAQDMHDSLGHQLTLISVRLSALEVDRELVRQHRQAVGVLRETSVTAMEELREVVGLLRNSTDHPDLPADLPDLAAVGEQNPTAPLRGAAGIENLVRTSRTAGMDVELQRIGTPRPLAPTADRAAYRIAQEGLTNAHKHSPSAPVTIELRYQPDTFLVQVTNGPAPEAIATGHRMVSGGQGLAGLRERTRLIGGTLDSGSTTDGGFRLAGVLPYSPPDAGAASHPPTAPVTTQTAAPGDARERVPALSMAVSGPVSDGNDLPQELATAIGGSTMRSSTAIACGVAGVLLLLVLPVTTGVVLSLTGRADPAASSKDHGKVGIGQSEAEVFAKLPPGDWRLPPDVAADTPPAPKNSECFAVPSGEFDTSTRKWPVTRFCFKDGKLVEKTSFKLKY